MNVMILAAGEGTRLKPYTLEKPKAAIPFLSVPMGYFSLSLLDGVPIDRLVVNTHYLPEQIETLYRRQTAGAKELHFSSEKEELLDSGGGIHKAQDLLRGRENFFVLNGDEVILPQFLGTLPEMLKFHRWHQGIATLLTMPHPEVGKKFGGVWVHEDGSVACFAKKDPQRAGVTGRHFLGVLLLSDRIFNYFKNPLCKENILYDTLTAAIAAGEAVHSFHCQAHWFETGNPADFMIATDWALNELQKKDRPYWKEYLEQTIRLFGTDSYVIEKNWQRFLELQAQIKKLR